jgi:hypothetical protein
MAADFTEHRLLRDWPTDSAALADAVAVLQARGAMWLHTRFGDTLLIVEGWRDRPTGRRARVAVQLRASPAPSSR